MGACRQASSTVAKDVRRDAYLTTLRMRVLQFDDRQVLQELDAVMEAVFLVIGERLTENPPTPSSCRGGI